MGGGLLANHAVTTCRGAGITVAMLSGDHTSSVGAISQAGGVAAAFGTLLLPDAESLVLGQVDRLNAEAHQRPAVLEAVRGEAKRVRCSLGGWGLPDLVLSDILSELGDLKAAACISGAISPLDLVDVAIGQLQAKREVTVTAEAVKRALSNVHLDDNIGSQVSQRAGMHETQPPAGAERRTWQRDECAV